MAKSSTKKAARLAQKGKGQRIRFQGGAVFPLAVAITLIAGLALIAYSRQTVPAADASPPGVNDHWHAAHGFYLCDGWVQVNGALEERNSQGQFTNVNFLRTGVHSHDDGVIHWHPYTSRATGRNATLGVFLETYDIEMTDDTLRFPSLASVGPNPAHPGTGPSEILQEYIEGETTCDGEDAELTVKAWTSYTDTDAGRRYIANIDRVHLDNDGMVFGIYFTPRDADQVMPPWSANLPALGAIDVNQLRADELGEILGQFDETGDLGDDESGDTDADDSDTGDESGDTDADDSDTGTGDDAETGDDADPADDG